MKRSVWSAVLFAMSSVGVVGGLPAIAHAQPVKDAKPAARNVPPIVFEPEICDLGVGRPGEVLSRVVTVRNTGATALKVTRLKGSCSCTIPSISSEVIPPGESVEMTVEMDPGWLPSKVRKQVNVFAEGFNRPATVAVWSEVSFAVRVEKPVVKLSVNDPVATVNIESIDGEPFRVTRINGKETDGKGLSVVSETAADSHEISYAYGDEEIPTYMVVETDHPEACVIAVRMEHPVVSKRERQLNTAGLKSDRHFINVDCVYPGETVEVIFPVSGLAAHDVPKVSFVDDERLEVRYMGKTEHPDKRSWYNVKLFVTVKDRQSSGMFNASLKLEVPDSNISAYTYVIGSITPESGATAKSNQE